MKGWKYYEYITWDFVRDVPICNPVVTVHLSINGGVPISLDGLVDSGAHDTIIHSNLAPSLGVDLTKCRKVPLGGVGGRMDGYETSAHIEVEGFPGAFETPVVFANIPIQLLLGQEKFFDNFQVLFEKDNARFGLKRVKKLDLGEV